VRRGAANTLYSALRPVMHALNAHMGDDAGA
jgi:hypothetical protein